MEQKFFCEYSEDVSNVPESIAVIPLIANILPIIWIYDSELYIEECDRTFVKSIETIKRGYCKMYPMIDFGGRVIVNQITDNFRPKSNKTLSYFSGGVDSYNTIINHHLENPVLFTAWGSDVFFDDYEGWNNMLKSVSTASQIFNSPCVNVKSSFRMFINYTVLDKKVKKSADNWWHGFQHGIGLLSLCAPISYKYNIGVIYFASTYSEKNKGSYTCASDPTIDNYFAFANTVAIHDGYKLSRLQKIENIVNYSNQNNVLIPLRVCWESKGGKNCCSCEKCWRTIFELYAIGAKPEKHGFIFTKNQLMNTRFLYYKMNDFPTYTMEFYRESKNEIKQSKRALNIPFGIKWMYYTDVEKYCIKPFWYKVLKKIKKLLK